ncbi:PAS domain S-box protein [bacterium]|nr:PAS domain S-box protein [bacterium]
MNGFRRRTLIKRSVDREKSARWAVDAFQATTMDELLNRAASNAASLFQSPLSVLFLVEENNLVAKAAKGLDIGKTKTAKIPIGKSLSGRLVKHGEPRLFLDVSHYIQKIVDNIEPYYSGSVASTPLVFNKQIIGLINICRPAPLTPFSREDLTRLINYGSQTAFAITSQRLVDKRTSELNKVQIALLRANEQLKKDIAKRKLMEEALRSSEEQYRTMIEYSNDMIWTLDREGNFKFFNKMSEEISGYPLEDWLGKSFAPMLLPEDLPRIQKVFQETMSGKSQQYEVSVKRKDGSIFLLSVNTAPIFKRGEVIGTVSFGRDITERKKAEEELQKRLGELEIYYRATIGRESRIIELKHQVNELLERLGEKKKYKV